MKIKTTLNLSLSQKETESLSRLLHRLADFTEDGCPLESPYDRDMHYRLMHALPPISLDVGPVAV